MADDRNISAADERPERVNKLSDLLDRLDALDGDKEKNNERQFGIRAPYSDAQAPKPAAWSN